MHGADNAAAINSDSPRCANLDDVFTVSPFRNIHSNIAVNKIFLLHCANDRGSSCSQTAEGPGLSMPVNSSRIDPYHGPLHPCRGQPSHPLVSPPCLDAI